MKYLSQIIVLQEHIEKLRLRTSMLQNIKSLSRQEGYRLETLQQLDHSLNQTDEAIITTIEAIALLGESDV